MHQIQKTSKETNLNVAFPQHETFSTNLSTYTAIEVPIFPSYIESYVRRKWSEVLGWYGREVVPGIMPVNSEQPILVGPGYKIDIANLVVSIGAASGPISRDERGYEIFRIIVGLPFIDEEIQWMAEPLLMAKGLSGPVGQGRREDLEHPLIKEYKRRGSGNKQLQRSADDGTR